MYTRPPYDADEPKGIYKYLPRSPGEWEQIEGKQDGFVDGYGVFFEDFRASKTMTRAEVKEIEDEEKKKEEMRRTGELSDSDSDEDSEEEERRKKKKQKKKKGGDDDDDDDENENAAGSIWKRVDKAAKQLVRAGSFDRDRLVADYWTVLCVMYCGGGGEQLCGRKGREARHDWRDKCCLFVCLFVCLSCMYVVVACRCSRVVSFFIMYM